MKKIIVLEGDLLFRNKIKQIIYQIESDAVVDTFSSISATSISKTLDYDLAIVNYNLPVVTGVEAINFIKNKYNNLPVITISSNDKKDLIGKIGDFFLKKPKHGDQENLNIFQKLLEKMMKEAKSTKRIATNLNAGTKNIKSYKNRKFDLILVACSTGGPRTLESVFEDIKKPDIPIGIIQHMPENFTNFFATSLTKRLGIDVKEAEEGEEFNNSSIILAKGGSHLRFKKESNKVIIVNDNETRYVNSVRPSADVTFESASEIFGNSTKILILVLTGIGADGTKGIQTLKDNNSNVVCITESKDSCVIYGMPKNVDIQGLSDYSMSKEEINKFLKEVLN